MSYTDFLKTKIMTVHRSGFDWPWERLPEKLFDWQKDVVLWALRNGSAALFEDCGLGKTPQQLAWAQAVSEHEGKPVLILAPLAVSEQTKREGVKFGIEVTVCRTQQDVKRGVNIANYEMMQHFDAGEFGGIVLDESSILKAYMGKTKRMLVEKFAEVPYKLACTATPAPNDLMELLNHAEYLGIMRSSEALSIWFIADQTNSGTYRLKGHAEEDFWLWVSGWAVCLDKPSDLGYHDTGYNLPQLIEKNRVIQISEIADDFSEGFLRNINMSATGFYREKRRTLKERVAASAEIANATEEPCLVWCLMNEESAALQRAIPDAVEITGSDSAQAKEKAALDFIDGKVRVLISKPSIFGFGLNFQHCHRAIFCGMDYSYEGYYQAVRRLYRFGQEQDVIIHRVIGSTELQILRAQERKAAQQAHIHGGIITAMREAQANSRQGERFALNTEPQTTVFPHWLREEVSA